MTTRIYAELGLVNEAILRAVSRDDLFQRFCHAIVSGSSLIATAILLVETNNRLHYAAGAGDQDDTFRNLCAATHGDSTGVRDLCIARHFKAAVQRSSTTFPVMAVSVLGVRKASLPMPERPPPSRL